MNRCSHCKSRYPNQCMATDTNNPRICDLSNPDHADYDPGYGLLVSIWNPIAPSATVAEMVRSSRVANVNVIQDQNDISRQIHECEFRTPPTCQCPNEPSACSHPDRPDKVEIATCYACKLGHTILLPMGG